MGNREGFPLAEFRSLNRRNSFGDCLFRLISPPMKFPPQAVIGGSSPPEIFLLAAYTPPLWMTVMGLCPLTIPLLFPIVTYQMAEWKRR